MCGTWDLVETFPPTRYQALLPGLRPSFPVRCVWRGWAQYLMGIFQFAWGFLGGIWRCFVNFTTYAHIFGVSHLLNACTGTWRILDVILGQLFDMLVRQVSCSMNEISRMTELPPLRNSRRYEVWHTMLHFSFSLEDRGIGRF